MVGLLVGGYICAPLKIRPRVRSRYAPASAQDTPPRPLKIRPRVRSRYAPASAQDTPPRPLKIRPRVRSRYAPASAQDTPPRPLKIRPRVRANVCCWPNTYPRLTMRPSSHHSHSAQQHHSRSVRFGVIVGFWYAVCCCRRRPRRFIHPSPPSNCGELTRARQFFSPQPHRRGGAHCAAKHRDVRLPPRRRHLRR